MKHAKKLAALFLAMVMALSLTAMTASAYGADEHAHDETCAEATIQPRKVATRCTRCGGSALAWETTEKNPDNTTYTVRHYECSDCGYWSKVL